MPCAEAGFQKIPQVVTHHPVEDRLLLLSGPIVLRREDALHGGRSLASFVPGGRTGRTGKGRGWTGMDGDGHGQAPLLALCIQNPPRGAAKRRRKSGESAGVAGGLADHMGCQQLQSPQEFSEGVEGLTTNPPPPQG